MMLVLGLAACGRGIENKDAVRQGVIDYLATRGNLNIQQMNVEVVSVAFQGNRAEATVSFAAKGGKVEGPGMTIRYTLEKQASRWVVKGRADAGGAPHGGMGEKKK
jgi:hypothetical protein